MANKEPSYFKRMDAALGINQGSSGSGSSGGGSSTSSSSSTKKGKKEPAYFAEMDKRLGINQPAPEQPALEDFANANPLSATVQSLTNQRDAIATPKYSDPMSKYMQRRGVAELTDAIQNQTQRERAEALPRNPITGTVLTPIGKPPQSQQIHDLLVGAATKKDTPAPDVTAGEVSPYRKELDDLTAQRNDLEKQMSDVETALGRAVDPAQRQQLNTLLDTLLTQRDDLEDKITTAESNLEAEPDQWEIAAAERKDKKSQYEALNGKINEFETALGMAYTPEEQDAIRQQMAPLVEQREALRQELDIPTTGERITSILEAAGLGVLAGNVDTQRSLYELGQGQRTRQTEERIAELEKAIEDEKRQRAEDEAYYKEKYFVNGEDTGPGIDNWLSIHDNYLESFQRELDAYRKVIPAQEGATKETAEIADHFSEVASAATEKAKTDLNGVESFLVDAGINGVQMLTDAALNLATGTPGSLVPLVLRSYGGGTQAARQAGADINQQVLFGAASAAVEGLTEKMFDGLAGIYGKGYADDMTELIIQKIASESSPEVKAALTIFLGGAGESAEEAVSGRLEPWLQAIYDKGQALKDTYGSGWENYINSWAEDGYSMLVGFAMGFAGTSVSEAQNIQNNTANENEAPTAPQAEQQTAPKAEQQASPKAVPQTPNSLLDVIQNSRNAETGQVTRKGIDTILADQALIDAFNENSPEKITGNKADAKTRGIIRNNADAVVSALAGEETTTETGTQTVTPTTEAPASNPVVDALAGEEAPTTTAENAVTPPQIETAQQEGINTPKETETEQAAETPQQNTEETAPEAETAKETAKSAEQKSAEPKPRELTKSQQKVSDMLSQGEITDDVVQKIAKNDNYIKAVEDLTGTEFPKNQKAQAKFLQNLAQDLSTYGSPDAYLVAKMKQDNGIKTVQSELQYKIDQLTEEIKAAEMRGEADKVKALTAQRVNYERKIQQQKDILKKYKQQQKAKREAKKVKAVTEKINGLIKDLKNRAVRPTEGKYIPQGLQGAVADAMAAITESQAGGSILQTDKKLADLAEKLQNAKTADEAETYLKQWDSIVKKDERLQTNFGKVLDAVAEMRKTAENTNDVRPEILQDYVNSIATEIGDTPFYLMDSTQLGEVYNALKAINTLVNNTVNSKILGKMQLAYESAIELRNEVQNARTLAEAREDGSFIGNTARAGLSAAELGFNRPQVVFNLMGGRHVDSAFNALYNSFNEAYHDKIEMTVKGREYFNDLLDDSKGVRSMRDKVTVKGIVNSDGKEISMSRGMRLYLRMLLDNANSARSIALGGLTIPDTKAYYLGVNDNGFGTTRQRSVGTSEELNTLRHDYRKLAEQYNKLDSQTDRGLDWQTNIDDVVTQMDAIEDRINNILEENGQSVEDMKAAIDKDLTAYEKEWIAKAREFFDWAGGEVDAANLAEFGFNKATVENYVPMMRDANFRNSSVENIVRDMSIRNWGAMKTRSNFASQPLMLMDLFDVCDSYLQKSSIYAKVMPTINEFERIWNTVEATENESGNLESLRNTITDKFGKAGVQYIDNLIKDMQGGRGRSVSVLGVDVTGLSNALNRARGNLAKASLTMNPGVALGQTASLLSAGAKIPTRYILKALATPENRSARDALINEHTPMLKDRQQGSGSIIKADANVVDRAYNKMNWLTGWIQNMDSWTVSKLWQASEYYVQDQLGIDKNSEGYYETVTDTWEEILETTQPEYNPLQRPDVLRSPDTLVKSMTMFMTQRIQNYNTLFDSTANLEQAVHDVQEAKKSGDAEKIAQAQDALKTRGTEFARGVSSVIASSAAYVAIRALADGLMHKWDKFRDEDTGEITGEKILERTAWMFGETLAGCIPFGNAVFTALESAITGDNYYGINVNGISNISKAVEDIVGVGKAVFSDADKDKLLDKAHKAAKSLADMLGIPASNTEKLVQSALDWYGEIQNMVENDAALGEFYEFSAKQNKNRLTDALENGDSDKAAKIMESMGETAEKYAKEAVKEAYNAGDIDTATAVDYLADLGINGARDTVFEWKDKAEYKQFQEDHPETSMNQTAYNRYEQSENKPEQAVFEKTVDTVTAQTNKSFGDVTQGELYDYLKNDDSMSDDEKGKVWRTWFPDAKDSYSGKQTKELVQEAKTGMSGEYDSTGDNAVLHMLLDSDLSETGKDEAMSYAGKSIRDDYTVLREADYTPDEIIDALLGMDALGKDKSLNNGSISQAEMKAFYKKYPELEALVATIWDSREYKHGSDAGKWENNRP